MSWTFSSNRIRIRSFGQHLTTNTPDPGNQHCTPHFCEIHFSRFCNEITRHWHSGPGSSLGSTTEFSKIDFELFLITCVHCGHHTYLTVHTWRLGTICRNWRFPSTMWAQGIKLGPSGLLTGAFIHWAIPLAQVFTLLWMNRIPYVYMIICVAFSLYHPLMDTLSSFHFLAMVSSAAVSVGV